MSFVDSPNYLIFRVLKGNKVMQTTLTAYDIRHNGKKIKSWEERDGSWYINRYEIWRLGEHYYQILDHDGVSLSCTGCVYGQISEVEKPEPVPTHLGILIAVKDGKAWVESQFQGTPDKIAEWYDLATKLVQSNPYKRGVQTYLKIIELSFE